MQHVGHAFDLFEGDVDARCPSPCRHPDGNVEERLEFPHLDEQGRQPGEVGVERCGQRAPWVGAGEVLRGQLLHDRTLHEGVDRSPAVHGSAGALHVDLCGFAHAGRRQQILFRLSGGPDDFGWVVRPMTCRVSALMLSGERSAGGPQPGGGAVSRSGGDRRDETTRALRNAVAGWFGIHPSCLAPLDQITVERMELRLEGRRSRPPRGVHWAPEAGHPWAG